MQLLTFQHGCANTKKWRVGFVLNARRCSKNKRLSSFVDMGPTFEEPAATATTETPGISCIASTCKQKYPLHGATLKILFVATISAH
jgi:hypothetical protein